MNGPRECHTELSKSEREREILYDIPYMWNLKRNDTHELTYKAERDSQTKNKLISAQGKGKSRI